MKTEQTRTEPEKSPGTGQPASTHAPKADINAKIFPPDSPVDVPNMPAPRTQAQEDQAREQSGPAEDDSTDSSWADNTKPAPRKKNARTSIF